MMHSARRAISSGLTKNWSKHADPRYSRSDISPTTNASLNTPLWTESAMRSDSALPNLEQSRTTAQGRCALEERSMPDSKPLAHDWTEKPGRRSAKDEWSDWSDPIKRTNLSGE